MDRGMKEKATSWGAVTVPIQKDVDEVTAWLIEDDVEDYLFEMHIENIVRDSMEKLGAKTTESVTWTEWETSNAS